MSEVPIPGGGGLQHDLEGILGRSAIAVEPLIRLSSPSDHTADPPAPPMVVLLPRDVPRRPQRPGWIVPAAGCAGAILVALAGFVVVRTRDQSAPAPAAAPVTVAAVSSAAPVTTTVVAATTTSIAAATAATALEPRSALYAGGKVYLQGTVPDAATARTIVERAGAVVGPDNVVDEYVVDAAAPATDSGPLRIADTVQFAAGSAQLAPEFRGPLDLGIVLLQRFPAVHITVIGHTDAAGDALANQQLSQRRVDAVVAYLLAPGVDAARVVGVAKGEAEPIAGNDTAEGRRLNRRIEFVITGLLDG